MLRTLKRELNSSSNVEQYVYSRRPKQQQIRQSDPRQSRFWSAPLISRRELRIMSTPWFQSVAVVALLVFCAWQEGAAAFQSDELPEDDDEWGIVGGGVSLPPKLAENAKPAPAMVSGPGAGDRLGGRVSTPSADGKVQFALEHAFGGPEFSPAGVFTARLRDSVKSGQHGLVIDPEFINEFITHWTCRVLLLSSSPLPTAGLFGILTLSKFRLSRDPFSSEDKKKFQELLESDGFYSIRVSSNVLNPGESFALSSVKARCLAESNFQERFVFHMHQGHIIGVTYGGLISCSYPRALQTPSQWEFDSLIIVKTPEQASRSLFAPEIVEVARDDDIVADDGTLVKKLPEKSFWSKYWMYIVPVSLILVNAITQFANLPEEGAAGQGTAGAQPRVGGPGGGGARRR